MVLDIHILDLIFLIVEEWTHVGKIALMDFFTGSDRVGDVLLQTILGRIQ